MNYTIIEKSPEERNSIAAGLDPLNTTEKGTFSMWSLGIKWENDREWYGAWGEYAPGYDNRERAWGMLFGLTHMSGPLSESQASEPAFKIE